MTDLGFIPDKCMYCSKSTVKVDDRIEQVELFYVHDGSLKACQGCVSKYALPTYGSNKIKLDWEDDKW